jgi:phospholipid N-methyltransferase
VVSPLFYNDAPLVKKLNPFLLELRGIYGVGLDSISNKKNLTFLRRDIELMLKQNQIRLQPDKRIAFFKSFLKRPSVVGSVIPSSRFLERRIVQLMDVSSAKRIVELGPGTGGVSRAVLRAMGKDAKLLSIELNSDFISILSKMNDPRFIVHEGEARRLREILQQYGFKGADAIFSGIPFSTMSQTQGKEILEAVSRSLLPGGRFIAYQFRNRVAEVGCDVFGPPKVKFELLNVPPCRLYCWQKEATCSA